MAKYDVHCYSSPLVVISKNHWGQFSYTPAKLLYFNFSYDWRKELENSLNISLGIDIYYKSYRNEDNQTPLHLAARGGHQEMVELLVSKHHAEVDARDKQDRTPLHWAAVTGHSDVVTTLLQHKADLTAVSADLGGRNALEIAIDRGKE